MPSGRIHDRITLWSLPTVTALCAALTRNGNVTLLVSAGFLFSGLMLSPDLDLYSQPFKRWGWLRWIWIPYQKAMHHRSIFSHGPIIGTTIRVLYLAGWTVLFGILIFAVLQSFQDVSWSPQQIAQDVGQLFSNYRAEWVALFVGLELGAMSHSCSDWINSAYKRLQKKSRSNRTSLRRSRFPAPAPSKRKSISRTTSSRHKPRK